MKSFRPGLEAALRSSGCSCHFLKHVPVFFSSDSTSSKALVVDPSVIRRYHGRQWEVTVDGEKKQKKSEPSVMK